MTGPGSGMPQHAQPQAARARYDFTGILGKWGRGLCLLQEVDGS